MIPSPPMGLHMGEDGLLHRIIRFSTLLKRHGFKVFPSSVTEALRALDLVGLSDREVFFFALRSALVRSDLEWRLFDEVFETFWSGGADAESDGSNPSSMGRHDPLPEETFQELPGVGNRRAESCSDEDLPHREVLEGATYSPVPSFESRDFDKMRPEDLQFARLALKNMIAPFRIAASRRSRRSHKPRDMDFRRTFRESLKAGGVPLRIRYRQRKKRLRRLVVLADVSGSMDRYARFVMPFLMGIKGAGVRTDLFVFSTSLTCLSPLLRHHDVEEVLDLLSGVAPDWSGGTRIGFSLRQFNREHGNRSLGRHSVVVVLSDGWDLGSKEMLRREMAAIHQRARCVVWLNPAAGDPDLKPLYRGMQAVLPYVHHVLPVDSLKSLMRAGHVLASVLRER